jgi:methionine sulfoxide reductase heme-binding subunit
MSATYTTVQWSRQKRRYDRIMVGLMALYILIFTLLELLLDAKVTPETLIIRVTGTLSFLMLHVILCIGPLTRFDARFLPLLSNRRHLGVTTFLIGTIHGIFNIVQFHTLGYVDPLVSLFASNTNYLSFQDFPFQVLGFFALIILFLMAATSHDFWLKNLHPKVWKSLHMLVYVAYALLVFHVMLGVIQLEQSPAWIGLMGVGLTTVVGLHLIAGNLSKKQLATPVQSVLDGFQAVCNVNEIADNRAKIVYLNGENIAIFKYEGKVSAVNNICRHQHGPIGEGKIVDGCITCPWHGYQYYPGNGQSPPPFTEKLETYDVKVEHGQIWVNPTPYPEGTERPAAMIN